MRKKRLAKVREMKKLQTAKSIKPTGNEAPSEEKSKSKVSMNDFFRNLK